MKVSKDAMPLTYDLISSISAKNPDALKGLPSLFKRAAINLDLSDVVPPEDLVATTRTKPVAAAAKPKTAAAKSKTAAAKSKTAAAKPAPKSVYDDLPGPRPGDPDYDPARDFNKPTDPADPYYDPMAGYGEEDDEEDPEDLKATDKVPAVAGPGQEEPDEEESDELKVGDIVRVKETGVVGIDPGDFEVTDLYDVAGRPRVLLKPHPRESDAEGGYTEHLKTIVDNPHVFKINPEAEEAEEEEDSKWDNALNKVQAGLDVAGVVGLFPPAMIISKPATLASLALNTSRGKYGWALFDLISLTPLMGEAMKAGKLGGQGNQGSKNQREWQSLKPCAT